MLLRICLRCIGIVLLLHVLLPAGRIDIVLRFSAAEHLHADRTNDHQKDYDYDNHHCRADITLHVLAHLLPPYKSPCGETLYFLVMG